MQKDLRRMTHRKRRVQRIIAITLLMGVAAGAIVMMRSCADHFNEPYNKDYTPMDIKRFEQQQEKKP